MALILNLETATDVCSVALAKDGVIISLQEDRNGRSHNSLLAVFIDKCFKDAGIVAIDLDAIAVSKGPGSYTGLRIGVSSAKGLCYAISKPLISVNTLQSMSYVLLKTGKVPADSLLCPMIDARRMEVYTAFFDEQGLFVKETSAQIITQETFAGIPDSQHVIFFGDGMPKTQNIIGLRSNFSFNSDTLPSASGMVVLAEKAYSERNFENLAYFEPFYLKDFLGTKHL